MERAITVALLTGTNHNDWLEDPRALATAERLIMEAHRKANR